MLKGTLTLTTDINVVNVSLYTGARVLFMTEEVPPQVQMLPSTIPATILLPSYEAIAAELDGDINAAKTIYYNQLQSRECDMYITAVLLASSRGIPITIYIGPDEATMNFLDIFMAYFYNSYGVTLCTAQSEFVYNVTFEPIVLTKFYQYDLITGMEFIMQYPIGAPLIPFAVQKLALEFKPYVADQSPNGYANYFYNYIMHVKEANKPLIIPATIGGADDDFIRNSSSITG